MCRRFVISAAFLLGVFAVTAAGQQPVTPPQPAYPSPPKDKVEKKADPTDAAVTSALANDPDVKVAKAKVQLAEAELAKAKQAVVLRVMTLSATIKEHKVAVTMAQERVAWATRMVEKGMVTQAHLLEERGKMESAQAALARVETELKLLTGTTDPNFKTTFLNMTSADAVALDLSRFLTHKAADDLVRRDAIAALLAYETAFHVARAVKGPVPDRIRSALDKPVKLGTNGTKMTFEQALELFKKDAGLDVPVRYEIKITPIVSLGEELPVGAWLQLFADGTQGCRILVREYGVLVTTKDLAPPDAVSLFEFWKQKAATTEPKAPEPKK